jgi:hypothetical protein
VGGVSHRLAWAAAAGIAISPFGPVGERLQRFSSWADFHDEGPLLLIVRANRRELPAEDLAKGADACDRWVEAARALDFGKPVTEAQLAAGTAWTQAWEPWDDDERDAARDCVKFPCELKLDAAEARKVASAAREQRMNAWFGRIRDRLTRYLKTQERRGYEFPGRPIDPWAVMQARGMVPQQGVARPAQPSLRVRKLNLAPDKMKTLHQVVDVRIALSDAGPGGAREAVAWVRDAYTDHYFDSWGEWFQVDCDPTAKRIQVTQALVLEFDLLKQQNLVARLARPSLRNGVRDRGWAFLRARFGEWESKAEALPAGGASPSPLPSPSAPPRRARGSEA